MNSSLGQSRLNLKEYINRERIGGGSFGDVEKVEEKESGRILAVKSIPTNRLYIDAIKEEAENMLKVNSDYVIKVYEHGFDDSSSCYVLVMPFYSQGSFEGLMGRQWDANAVRLFLFQIATALRDLGRHDLLHLDLKPENILIAGAEQYVICDLGCSRKMDMGLGGGMSFNALKVSTNTRGGGTTEYGSADLVLLGEMTPYSDIWSLGVILYKLIFKKHPLMVLPVNYAAKLTAFQRGEVAIDYTLTPATQEFREFIPLLQRMLVQSRDKSKRISWQGILDMICDLEGIPEGRRGFVVTDFNQLLEFAEEAGVVLGAALHYLQKCKDLLTKSCIATQSLVSQTCIYYLSLTKQVATHPTSPTQDFWQFHLFETTKSVLTLKQKSFAKKLEEKAVTLSKELRVSIEYENLRIGREKLIFEYGKVYKALKDVAEPSLATQRAEMKKLRTVVEWVGFVNLMDYQKRAELKKFAHDLIYS